MTADLEKNRRDATARGGDLEKMITFPEGLVGFPDWRHFAIEGEQGQPIQEMVCLDEEDVSFFITSPENVYPGYECEISAEDQDLIQLGDEADALVVCTLTVQQNPTLVTANLAGPIVINRKTSLAKQLVVPDGRYSLRHPVTIHLSGEED